MAQPNVGRICVVGDGPAAYLASWVFSKHGHSVTHVIATAKEDAAQAAHVHVIGPEIVEIAQHIDPELAGVIKTAAEPGWTWTETHPGAEEVVASHISRRALMKVLTPLSPNTVCGDFDLSKGQYDLFVDATGGNRAVVRRAESVFGLTIEFEDCGFMEQYRTWEGQSKRHRKHFVRGLYPFRYYFEHTGHNWRLTLISSKSQPSPSPQKILEVLNHLNIDETPRTLARPKAMLGSPARRLRENPAFMGDEAGCPLILPFGDALLQTSPSLGFGIASIFQQAVILDQRLKKSHDLTSLMAQLMDYVDVIWPEAALHHTASAFA